ncbi:unnamed protein product [Closterium sp. Yama58-4]|nr:unnamed protein product [Closterium sp. Yama58-4]
MRTGNHVIETRAKQQQQQKQPNRLHTKVDELGGTGRAIVAKPGEISSRTAVGELGGISRTAVGELEIVREEKRSLEKCLKLVVEERDALLELAARNAAVAVKSVAGAKKEKERAVDRAAVFDSPPSPPRDSATAISKLGESLATADRASKSGASVERALPRRSRPRSAERVQRASSGEGSFRRSSEGRPQSAERGPRRAEIADGEPAEWEGGASALIALALEKERESKWEMEYRRELRSGEVMEGADALRRERGEDDRAKAREWEAKRDFLREERKRQLAREMGKAGTVVAGEKRCIEEKRAVEIGRREQSPLHAEARREWSHGKPTESGERRRLLERANSAKRESDRAERKERERAREMERAEQREREKEREEERGRELRREVERRREQEREQEQKRKAEKEREWRKDKAQAEAWEKECERLSEEVERLHEALQQARSELAGVRRLSAGAVQAGGESAEPELAKELEQTKLRLAKVEAERGQLASAVERMVLEMADAVREQEQFREALQHTSLDTMLLSHALGSVKTLQSTVHLMQQQLHREALEKASLLEKLAKIQSQRRLEAVQHQAYASSIHSLLSSLMLRFNFDRDPHIRSALEEANRTAHSMADSTTQLLEACSSAAPSNPLNAASNLYRQSPLGHESIRSLATVVPLPISESALPPDQDSSALPKRTQKRSLMSVAWKLLAPHASK